MKARKKERKRRKVERKRTKGNENNKERKKEKSKRFDIDRDSSINGKASVPDNCAGSNFSADSTFININFYRILKKRNAMVYLMKSKKTHRSEKD